MSDSDDLFRGEKKSKKKRKEKKEKKSSKHGEKNQKLYQRAGYTNESNPFGDTNLNQQFVWKKKAERDGGSIKSEKVSSRVKREREDHFYGEIQKVRKRRSEREAELEEQERLREEDARLREAEQYADWHKKEEEFHLKQARVRSKIRLVEGREKPIDILAKNIILLTQDEDDESGVKVSDLFEKQKEKRNQIGDRCNYCHTRKSLIQARLNSNFVNPTRSSTALTSRNCESFLKIS